MLRQKAEVANLYTLHHAAAMPQPLPRYFMSGAARGQMGVSHNEILRDRIRKLGGKGENRTE